MKFHIYLLLSFILISISSSVFAQGFNFGITINPGISKMTHNKPTVGHWESNFVFSGNIGVFFEKEISKKSAFGAEFLYVQMENKEITIFNENTSQIPEFDHLKTEYKLHSSYLGIPIYYRYQMNKIGLTVGIQSLIYIYGSQKTDAEGSHFGVPFQSSTKFNNISNEKLDLGAKIGLEYSINDRISLRADYYHGLLGQQSPTEYEKTYRQITFGGKYIIF